jgi:hypothetical protein
MFVQGDSQKENKSRKAAGLSGNAWSLDGYSAWVDLPAGPGKGHNETILILARFNGLLCRFELNVHRVQ